MDTPLTCFLSQALSFQKKEIEMLHQKLAAAAIANAESVKKINLLRNKLCAAYIAAAGAATIAPAASAARIPMNPEDDEDSSECGVYSMMRRLSSSLVYASSPSASAAGRRRSPRRMQGCV